MFDLPFLDRIEELQRLQRLQRQPQGRLGVVYGRRRCGKSRLLLESLSPARSVYFFCDQREASVQRAAMADAISTLVPGFGQVTYPDWDALLARWWKEAEPGWTLALDEFPNLVLSARELPATLQKFLDQPRPGGPHLLLCGSSQRMMQGLVLDRNAPLYGRAQEILRIAPLPAGWLDNVFPELDPVQQVETFALWGGIPRYWELARPFSGWDEALRDLVLSPLGVLHDEPQTLLQDDLSDTLQSSSLLQLIGQGCQRLSELAGRLGKPSTSLTRPLQRLVELDLVSRQKPFGSEERDSKRSFYRIGDPFLRFWYRYVASQRSRLQARQVDPVLTAIKADLPHFVAGVWEDLARTAIPRLSLERTWGPAQPWWGAGLDRKPLQIDAVAESVDGSCLLLASVKWRESQPESDVWAELRRHADVFPERRGRAVQLAVFCQRPRPDSQAIGPAQVLKALR